jgi:sulfur transfer complex TusBCD TusB component (DsrH family)
LVGKGIEVYVVEEDVTDRGLGNAGLVDGIQRVTRAGIPALMGNHDQVWYW